ncbi:DUF4221 family protein [Algoriphagus marinus]|uniref:DUF4221 family protein n=1 Tax=Algoriphagus marinus TaxID=1925762 RepID=UPI00094BA17E|nr:DUF4221 family protein [Algoriphagus marinus]
MRKLIPILFVIALASCGKKGNSEEVKSENILENLTYSVDTVVVDSGDEFINLKLGSLFSFLSPDHRLFYKYDISSMQLKEVDLDQLALTGSYSFEREGPNGVEVYGRTIAPLSNGDFIFSGQQRIGRFSKAGELIPPFDYKLNDLIDESQSQGDNLIQFTYTEKNNMGYFLETHSSEPVFNLIFINLDEKSSKVIDLPEMDRTNEYRIVLEKDGFRINWAQVLTVQAIDSKIYITTPVHDGIYRFEPVGNRLDYFSFPLTLTAKEKTKEIKNEVSSEGAMNEQIEIMNSEVRFYELLWDEESNRFYRFSSIAIPSNSSELSTKNEVYFSAFDSELNLIGETQLEEITKIPENPFFKDGKLWSYVNVEDELGFAVFTFDF